MQDADDVILEAEDGEGSTGTAEQKLKQLRDKLHKAESEATENLAGWQRSKADYINLQKRSRDELVALEGRVQSAVVEELLPVFDSIEASGQDVVLKQLDQTLERLGIRRFRPELGSVFDPTKHEAVSAVATNQSSEDNTVHSVMQSGYAQGDMTIRPARVTVYHIH